MAIAGMSAALIAPTAVARAEPSPAELTRRIETSSTELERVVESYNKLSEEIKTNKAAAARLQARIGPLEQQTEQSRADVGQAGRSPRTRAAACTPRRRCCDPDGSASLLDRLGTLDQLTRQRQERISGFTANQRRLLDEKTRLDATLARQAARPGSWRRARSGSRSDLAELYELRRQAYGRGHRAARAQGGDHRERPRDRRPGRGGGALRVRRDGQAVRLGAPTDRTATTAPG